jgi:molybdenum cofactor biosynthesis enzyme
VLPSQGSALCLQTVQHSIFSNKVLKILSKLHDVQQKDKTTAIAKAKVRYNIHGVSTSNISIQQPKKGTPLHAKKYKKVTSSGHTALPVMPP